MIRTTFITSIATLAIAAGAPALAKPGGVPAGGPNAGAPMGGMNAGAMDRANGGIQSQGAINANPRAMERASPNSVIRGNSTDEIVTGTRIKESSGGGSVKSIGDGRANGRVSATAKLTGVTTGTVVVDSSGATVGTVTGVRTTGNGSVKSAQITLTDGSVINVDSRSLSLAGGTLATSTTTGNVKSQGAANASLTALQRASPNSALATAGITTLTGLATGLTVNNSGGTSVGTVSGILTNRAGAVVGVQVALTGGGTVTLPATTLSMDGTTVVTTSTAVN